MFNSNQASFEPLLSIDTSTFSGTYQLVGTFTAPVRILVMVNGSNRAVTVSFDGSTDHAYFGASNATPQQFNFGAAKGTGANALDLPQGTSVYAKGTAGAGIFAVSSVTAITPN